MTKAEPPPERPVVLIIDDEKYIRDSFRCFLEDFDFVVIEAEDGSSGLDLFERSRPDIVLVDLRMPSVDGLDVLARVREVSPDTPAIVVSGTGVIADAVEALHLGAWDFLLKPIEDLTVLRHAVDKSLERARLIRENHAYQEHLEEQVKERTIQLEVANRELKQINRRQRTISEISSHFIGDPEFDAAVSFALASTGQLVNVSRTYLILTKKEGASVDNIHEWCAQGVDPRSECLRSISDQTFPWVLARLRRGEIVDIRDGSDLPTDALADLKQLHSLKIKSVLLLPIMTGDCLAGFMALENLRCDPRPGTPALSDPGWTEDDVSSIRVISEIIGSALLRQRAAAERLRLESKIQRAQKFESLTVMAGSIAHNFNNLLMALQGSLELALYELPAHLPARGSIERAQEAGWRAADLSNLMLTYVGQNRTEMLTIDLAELVEELTPILEVSVGDQARMQYEPCAVPALFEGDPSQIKLVIINLVANAAEAVTGSDQGLVTLRSGRTFCQSSYFNDAYLEEDLPAGEYVWLEVTDTGCGMDEHTRTRVFDPFFTTKFTGRGLGLSAVVGILRSHCGAVCLVSEPDRGTTVKVLFPAVEASAQNQPKPAVGPQDG